MPRVARIVIPGAPHHVAQRGNHRQDVSFVDDDYRVCLDRPGGSIIGVIGARTKWILQPSVGTMADSNIRRALVE